MTKVSSTNEVIYARGQDWTPWNGGEAAPADWNGGRVLLASEEIVHPYQSDEPFDWQHDVSESGCLEPGCIVGYVPGVALPPLALSAQHGEGEPVADDTVVLTITVEPGHTQCHTRAGNKVVPSEAVKSAIEALEQEQSDIGRCPAHRSKRTPIAPQPDRESVLSGLEREAMRLWEESDAIAKIDPYARPDWDEVSEKSREHWRGKALSQALLTHPTTDTQSDAQSPTDKEGDRLEWRPIESAPKCEVLLYYPEIRTKGRGLTHAEWVTTGRAGLSPRKPTHWMPLPEAPTHLSRSIVGEGE